MTTEELLQWLLQQCATLAEVPEPLMALRLLLAGALAASEEARGLEMLAYSFFEHVRARAGMCVCVRCMQGYALFEHVWVRVWTCVRTCSLGTCVHV